MEMVRTREDMLLVEECEEEGEEKREGVEEVWCPFARLEEHNLEWVIQVNYWRNDGQWTHPRCLFLIPKTRI